MSAMNSVLKKNQTKVPMLKFYHHVLDAYNSWQEGYAHRNGLDVATLRGEISQYNGLHGDSAAQRHFLTQHPELRRYQTAVRNDFDKSNDGLWYVLFHGQSKRAMQLVKARHLDLKTEAGTT